MNTIMILAEALAKAARCEISRLDIQYNTKTESYTGRVWLMSDNEILNKSIFDINEDGTVTLPH